jgi:hypothetical protein
MAVVYENTIHGLLKKRRDLLGETAGSASKSSPLTAPARGPRRMAASAALAMSCVLSADQVRDTNEERLDRRF